LITARAEFQREDGVLIAEASAQQLVLPMNQWPAEKSALEGSR
jgi:hypothetical protein